jgi:membrane protease YdiL (CAAX protease family)
MALANSYVSLTFLPNFVLNSKQNMRSTWALLVALIFVSPVVTTMANRLAVRGLSSFGGDSLWLGRTCIPSAIVLCAIYLFTRPALPFGRPSSSTHWKKVIYLSLGWLFVWLCGSILYAMAKGGWSPHVVGAASLVGFLIFGPLAEEAFFRGALFEVGNRLFGERSSITLVGSSILFSLHHFQLHGYQLNEGSLLQMAFTLPMGLVFGKVRILTKSIWPGYALHFVTNLIHAISI